MLDIEKKLAEANARSKDFAKAMADINDRLVAERKRRKSLQQAMKLVEKELQELLGARIFSIYQTIDNGKEITAVFKGGQDSENVDKQTIKVPLSTTSLSGYVALSHRSLCIKDVYDTNELQEIHKDLKFDARFSEARNMRFKSMVIVPIKSEILLGVIQLINLDTDPEFSRSDIKRATMLAQMLAKIFREDFQSTLGPYDYLVQQGKISNMDLDKVQAECSGSSKRIIKKFIDDYKVAEDDIGKSLELYYRVP